MGFEALSRGASSVVFVDKDRQIYKILEKNTTLFNDEKMRVYCDDVNHFISRNNKNRYDIVFADPPYIVSNYEYLQEKVKKILKPDGIFCMEMKKQDIEGSFTRIKYYGSTQVVFFKAKA